MNVADEGADTKDARFRLIADVVVSGPEAESIFRPGVVDVTGSEIAYVGPLDTAPDPVGGVERANVEVVGGLLMPGLVNAHGHTPMTLLRSAGDGLPLGRWLKEAIWPREAHLSDEDVYWGMLLGCEELLCNGVTTTTEMYVRDRSVVAAALDSGIRAVVTPGILDVEGAGPAGSWRSFFNAAVDLYDEFNATSERITVGFGPHSAYVLPEDALVEVARVASDVAALVHIHLSETKAEDLVVRERHGYGAPEVLARTGILDNRVLAAHGVWLSDVEMDLLAAHGAAVAHCPQSNGKLGSGIARVKEMLSKGVRVALGTDGPASNDDLDLWEEMRLAPLLARAIAGDATAVTTAEAFKMATSSGAESLGIDSGVLEAGKLADLIRVDLDHGCFTPALDSTELLSHLVWAASSRLVTDVWVGGRRVVKDHRCVTVDADEARREVSARARRIFEQASRSS